MNHNHIEQAMKEAVEKGGYKAGFHICWIEKYEICYQNKEGGTDTFVQSVESIFLDPLFWQALGKARGWDDNLLRREYSRIAWRDAMHRFIDHLAEGKDAESFFKNL